MSDLLRTNDNMHLVVNKYSDMLMRIAYTHLANHHDAEDMVQSVFLKYFEKYPIFENQEHEKAWFIRVVINMCTNHFRSSWFRTTVGLNENLEYPTFSDDEINEKAVLTAVMKLPTKYRTAVYLYYYEDYSTIQIARILKRKESTIRTQLFRGRQQLKDSLKEVFIDDQRYD